MNLQPRDYQDEARNRILATLGVRPWWDGASETFNSCVLNIPTSAGKTVIAGMVCESVSARGRFLYLADRDELTEQPMDKFRSLLGINASLDKGESKASRMSSVVIASIQTLSKQSRLERFPRDHFSFIFVDEAHREPIRAKKIRDYFHTAKSVGQTATAFRAKLKDLSPYYDTVAYELGLFDLIERGFIVPIKVQTLPVDIDITDVHQRDGDYDENELDAAITPYYNRIAELIVEHCRNRQIVTFLPLIKSSQAFVSICRQHGINARHIDGQSPNRSELKLEFLQRKFQLISCSSLLSTGWDCPPCDTLLNLAPTRFAGLWRQKVGRIVRPLPGVVEGLKSAEARRRAIKESPKPYALILDLLFHAEKFGLQGPADLIAANDKERKGIVKRLASAQGVLDLEEVTSDVQEEVEATLAEELREAARRKHNGLVDAQYYAAIMHDRDLENYEPVSKWMTEKVSEKQAEYLMKNGVDPATVTDRGHASAISSKIWGRKNVGLASWRTVQALEAKKVPGAVHYSEEQAYRFLQDDYPFPFGMPAKRNWTVGQVPASYWRWLAEQPWVERSWPIIFRRMEHFGLVKKSSLI